MLLRWPSRPDEQDSGGIGREHSAVFGGNDTSDGGFVLRELPSGAELVKLTPPRTLGIRDWAFSPNGKRLIVLSKQGQVVEWDLAELRSELARLRLDWQ